MNNPALRTGLLGGTFNPVHRGHLQLALAAQSECFLDKVVFIPVGYPPHKDRRSLLDFKHRIKMLEISCRPYPTFELSTIESTLPPPSYTIDTLRYFRLKVHPKEQLFFIIGADAFLEITTWKSYQQVLDSTNFILSPRKGYDFKRLLQLLERLRYTGDNNVWFSDRNKESSIQMLRSEPLSLSSSEVRADIKRGQDINEKVGDGVAEYIVQKSLYL